MVSMQVTTGETLIKLCYVNDILEEKRKFQPKLKSHGNFSSSCIIRKTGANRHKKKNWRSGYKFLEILRVRKQQYDKTSKIIYRSDDQNVSVSGRHK